MAILRSMDGKFYNIPDSELESHLVPADEVKSKLNSAAPSEAESKNPQAKDDGAVVPHGHGHRHWHNCWRRNCWRNCWHNCWH